jgi:hypothetical protein
VKNAAGNVSRDGDQAAFGIEDLEEATDRPLGRGPVAALGRCATRPPEWRIPCLTDVQRMKITSVGSIDSTHIFL